MRSQLRQTVECFQFSFWLLLISVKQTPMARASYRHGTRPALFIQNLKLLLLCSRMSSKTTLWRHDEWYMSSNHSTILINESRDCSGAATETSNTHTHMHASTHASTHSELRLTNGIRPAARRPTWELRRAFTPPQMVASPGGAPEGERRRRGQLRNDSDSDTNRKKRRNKPHVGLAAGNTQPISAKGVAVTGQSQARRCALRTCCPRHWPGARRLAVEGVSWSQRCHSKPGEPGRALQLGERLAGAGRERARTRTSTKGRK